MRLMDLMWLGLVLGIATSLFILKYEVQSLEDILAQRNSDIDTHTRSIKVLKAEWTFLSDPERLRRLGLEYLELAPIEPARIISMDMVPFSTSAARQTAAASSQQGVH